MQFSSGISILDLCTGSHGIKSYLSLNFLFLVTVNTIIAWLPDYGVILNIRQPHTQKCWQRKNGLS
jgi:hypothetical protein